MTLSEVSDALEAACGAVVAIMLEGSQYPVVVAADAAIDPILDLVEAVKQIQISHGSQETGPGRRSQGRRLPM